MMHDRFSKILFAILILMSTAFLYNFSQHGKSNIKVTRLPARSVQPTKMPTPPSALSTVPIQDKTTQTPQPYTSLELIKNTPSTVHSELEAKEAMSSLRLCTFRPGANITTRLQNEMRNACRNALEKIKEKFPSALKDATAPDAP